MEFFHVPALALAETSYGRSKTYGHLVKINTHIKTNAFFDGGEWSAFCGSVRRGVARDPRRHLAVTLAVRDGVKHFIIDSMYHLDHMQNLHMTDWLHNVILHMILSANNYHLRLGWPIPSRPKSNAPYSDRQTFFSELSSPVLSLLRIGTMITTNTE